MVASRVGRLSAAGEADPGAQPGDVDLVLDHDVAVEHAAGGCAGGALVLDERARTGELAARIRPPRGDPIRRDHRDRHAGEDRHRPPEESAQPGPPGAVEVPAHAASMRGPRGGRTTGAPVRSVTGGAAGLVGHRPRARVAAATPTHHERFRPKDRRGERVLSQMTRTALLALLVASCSSHPIQPAEPAAVAPERAPAAPAAAAETPPVSAAGSADEAEPAPAAPYTLVAREAAWKPHKCRRSVWPSYDPDAADDAPPAAGQGDELSCEDGGCGKTLDAKLADLNRARRDEGVCDTRHRDELAAAILRAPAPKPDPAVRAWDRKAPLEHRDLVRGALALTADEEKLLEQHGFVVPERLAYGDYTRAYYDVHRGQLPVYVTADSILHAVYASHDQLMAGIEREKLLGQLDAALGAMHCGLPAAGKAYPADVAGDVDLYLTVARSLLAGQQVPSELGKVDGLVGPIVEAIEGATAGPGTVELFGRRRSFDATQYTPRGHYAGDPDLERYFRAAMWLSRTELNLVSRDSASSTPGYDPDPRETPREAVVALALAELADRTKAAPPIAALERAWAAFAGRREDVPFAELGRLRAKAGIRSLTQPEAAERLRAAIGEGYVRTVNVHPMPNVARLPVIATMLGPRITPDTAALGALVGERGPDLRAAEIGYMLGHDRGIAYADPRLLPRLKQARGQLGPAASRDDLYGRWLEAIRGLAHRPPGALPSFTEGAAFADLRLGSAIAAYGQLRHNHVLVAAQVYDQGGCEIPDGYVEPAIDTYEALVEYARLGRTTFRALDPKDTTKGAAYFARLERLMQVLVALSREELANRPLSPSARRFLSMIVEMREASASGYMGTFPVATYDGWYLDLFPGLTPALRDAAFLADYATFDRNGRRGIHYIGAKGPRLGVFAVDVGGKPRMMVGPVATAFQHTGPLARRLSDEDAPKVAGSAPWAASYTAPAVGTSPPLTLELVREQAPRRRTGNRLLDAERPGGRRQHQDPLPPNTLRLEAERDLGEITVELLDHHFVKMAAVQIKVGKGRGQTALAPQPRPIESVRISTSGGFQQRLDFDLQGYLYARLGPAASTGD